MKVLHNEILIRQNAMSEVPKLVPAWQVDCYSEKYGDTLTLGREIEVELDSVPDTAEEHARMLGIFGDDPDTRQSYVEIVYGRGPRGRQALEHGIQAAIVVDGQPQAPRPRRPRRNASEDAAPTATPSGDGAEVLGALAGEPDPLAQY